MQNNQCVLIGVITALATFGCGGGGSGAVDEPGTVVVTVTNEIGDPAAGVDVSLRWGRGVSLPGATKETTDANGTITFTNVECCFVVAAVDTLDGLGRHYGGARGMLQPRGRLELAVELELGNAYPPVSGIASAAAVAADDHSLEFTLRMIYAPTGGYDIPHLLIANCAPDMGNDTPVHRADCVEGPAGFDSPYTVMEPLDPELTYLAGATTTFSAAMLIDQSRNVIARDPDDVRLFGAKYFLRNKGVNNRVALAAFAANDGASGDLRLLSDEPITTFPSGGLEFTTTGSDLFPSIDSLAMLEGGASPLYAAIDKLLNLTITSPSATGRKTIVVATAGLDDTCGSPTACHDAKLALIEKSRAAKVAIVVVGMAGAAPTELTQLTEATGGAALWAEDPVQLGMLFRDMGVVLDGSINTLAARFRIESPKDDAFQSGNTVLGNATFQACSAGCKDFYVPFAVRIP